MKKIISFSSESFGKPPIEEAVCGWIEDEDEYKAFRLTANNQIQYEDICLKAEYRDYEHFVGVQGKFDPYQSFLKKPVPVKSFTYPAMVKLFQNKPS